MFASRARPTRGPAERLESPRRRLQRVVASTDLWGEQMSCTARQPPSRAAAVFWEFKRSHPAGRGPGITGRPFMHGFLRRMRTAGCCACARPPSAFPPEAFVPASCAPRQSRGGRLGCPTRLRRARGAFSKGLRRHHAPAQPAAALPLARPGGRRCPRLRPPSPRYVSDLLACRRMPSPAAPHPVRSVRPVLLRKSYLPLRKSYLPLRGTRLARAPLQSPPPQHQHPAGGANQ
jgi:hypothetical protein